jgi:hypothetical protein
MVLQLAVTQTALREAWVVLGIDSNMALRQAFSQPKEM